MPTNDCEIIQTAENYFGKENVMKKYLIESLRCFLFHLAQKYSNTLKILNNNIMINI